MSSQMCLRCYSQLSSEPIKVTLVLELVRGRQWYPSPLIHHPIIIRLVPGPRSYKVVGKPAGHLVDVCKNQMGGVGTQKGLVHRR